jgi:uncharacterized repeat protein (TIGR03803 family)
MSKLKWGSWMMKACGVFLLWTVVGTALSAQTTPNYAPAVTFTTLHSFHRVDGTNPFAGLIQGIDGNLHGATYRGGGAGTGEIFTITPSGALTLLYRFCRPNCLEGAGPTSEPVQDIDGNFYGTTLFGGVNDQGTVFRLTPSGNLTTLYSFCPNAGCPDGSQPSGLVRASDGSFYGTTFYGGAGADGTVFRITAGGTLEITAAGELTTLHSFDGTDGTNLESALVQGSNGKFYGTTSGGGPNQNSGTVFSITAGGEFTTLHNFNGADGNDVFAGLVQGTDGNFYGTTFYGGTNDDGTIFKITPSGALTTLYNFAGMDGENPYAGLVQDTNGAFFGTTYVGGKDNNGSVFSLSVGLGPFVAVNPTASAVGVAVNILGTNLTGATNVTFNGVAASFTVVSASLITTKVPSGATTGFIQVVTPKGTLSSNVQFGVTP